MFLPRKLDLQKSYKPNLQNIQESAERTYGEGNSFFSMAELYLKSLEHSINNGKTLSEKHIYDASHALASILAESCEMYLKAIYLYENSNLGHSCTDLWEVLEARSADDKVSKDKNGNVIYYRTKNDNKTPLKHADGSTVYVYQKIDSNGNSVNGQDGRAIFVDKFGNEYDYNSKGRALKTNGHALDRLINLISPESRMLLETRMLTIPMESTEQNNLVRIIDMLQRYGLFHKKPCISKDQYVGWIDQHRRIFEDARYSGQKQSDVSVEFMYHLTTQIKAVAQYRIVPEEDQKFTMTEDKLSAVLSSKEIQDLIRIDRNLLSEKLMKLVSVDNEMKEKITYIIANNYIYNLLGINSDSFYLLVSQCDLSEIVYISKLIYSIRHRDSNIKETINDSNVEFIKIFSSIDHMISFCIEMKDILNLKVDYHFFESLSSKLESLLNSMENYISEINMNEESKYIQSAITALINEVSTYKVEVDIVTSSIMNEQTTRNDEYLADKSSHITKQTIPLTEEKSKPFRL